MLSTLFFPELLDRFPEIIGIPLKPEIRTKAGLVWRRGRYLNSGMQKFLDFCKESYELGVLTQ